MVGTRMIKDKLMGEKTRLQMEWGVGTGLFE